MHPYKPGYILTLRVTEAGRGNRMKAEVVNDEFQKCTVTVHPTRLDPSILRRLARHLGAKPLQNRYTPKKKASTISG